MTGNLNLGNNNITNLATPVNTSDATTKSYVDTINTNITNGKLNRDGTQAMTGDLNMGTNNITNVVDPVNAQDAATKNYVDTADSALQTSITNLTNNKLNRDGT